MHVRIAAVKCGKISMSLQWRASISDRFPQFRPVSSLFYPMHFQHADVSVNTASSRAPYHSSDNMQLQALNGSSTKAFGIGALE